jgi:hypothetical protein
MRVRLAGGVLNGGMTVENHYGHDESWTNCLRSFRHCLRIVYADPTAGLPSVWQAILDARKYIFVAAENARNDQPRGRRLGLAVLGALKAMKIYRIDPNRVYAAGFSGGARNDY